MVYSMFKVVLCSSGLVEDEKHFLIYRKWMWSRALDVRLSEWCCSVSMVWVQIPSREEQKKNLTALKSNSNTVWFNFQTYIYIYI